MKGGANLEDKEERALIVGLKNGTETAYEQLLDRYAKRLYRSCILLNLREEEAEDVVQETFVRVVLHIRKFKGKSSLYTWMYQIAINLVRDRWKQNSRWTEDEWTEEYADDCDIEAAVLERMDREYLRQAVRKLPDIYRQSIVMFYYEGLSIKAIAQLLEEAEGTIKSRLCRARALLKQSCHGEEKGGENLESK